MFLFRFSEDEKDAVAAESGDKIKDEKADSTEQNKKLDNGTDASIVSGMLFDTVSLLAWSFKRIVHERNNK